jgi:hypothetical protein
LTSLRTARNHRLTLQAVPREQVLQFDFRKTPVTTAPQTMPTRQFTKRAFDGVAPVHPLLKCLGALFDPALLQKLVVFADDERAMLFTRWHALGSQGAVLTAMLAPFETVKDLHLALLAQAQPAAVAARVARRAAGASICDLYCEVFYRQALHARSARAGRGRAHQRPAFLGGPVQPGPRNVSAVSVEFGWKSQVAARLSFQRLI